MNGTVAGVAAICCVLVGGLDGAAAQNPPCKECRVAFANPQCEGSDFKHRFLGEDPDFLFDGDPHSEYACGNCYSEHERCGPQEDQLDDTLNALAMAWRQGTGLGEVVQLHRKMVDFDASARILRLHGCESAVIARFFLREHQVAEVSEALNALAPRY